MSIQSEINRITANVADAYQAVEDKGGAVPDQAVSDNLAAAIASIPAGGTQDLINAPIGCIMAWAKSAEEIPEGWHICDGEDGTVDLRDKFILGAGENHPAGETGGSEEVTLTVEQMPNHAHTSSVYDPNGNSTSKFPLEPHGEQGVTQKVSRNTYGSAGGNGAHSNMPPYLALIFIQKISASPADYVTEERLQEAMENVDGSEDVYSTEEVRIGTWIDGRPLYRKTVTVSSGSGVWHTILTNFISGYKVLVQLTGTVEANLAEGKYFSVPYMSELTVGVSASGDLECYCSNSIWYNKTLVITALYTKTTEEEPELVFEWWSPHMTSDNTPAPYVVAASSEEVPTNVKWYAFDSNSSTKWVSQDYTSPQWISFDFGKEVAISAIRVTAFASAPYSNEVPRQTAIYGSNDGTNWDLVYTSQVDNSSTPYQSKEHKFETVTYRHYRIQGVSKNWRGDYYFALANVEFYKDILNQ